MTKFRLTRRALLGSIFGLLPLLKPAGAGDRDRGIGGTGVVAQPPEDRGIGGTGVIGTIREFGSIIVNDMRIAYSEYALLEIDGQPAPHSDLRLGQVVRVVAVPTATGLETERINVFNEVVGPISDVAKGALTVLGQTVSTQSIGDKGWKKGQWIAVSGLRNLDGTIVASLAEVRGDKVGDKAAGARVARVAGPVTLAPDGAAQIGGLKLANLDPAFAGRRVLAVVDLGKGGASALKTVVDPEISAMPGVRRISIEAFVANTGVEARFGSGLMASTPPQGAATPTPSRAIVTVTVNRNGSLTATEQKPAPAPGPARPDRGPPGSPQQPSKPREIAPGETRRRMHRNDFRHAPHHAPVSPHHAPSPAPHFGPEPPGHHKR